MRSLALLVIAIAGLGVTAAVSPMVAAGLGPGFTFARVYDRVFEILLVVSLVLAWRRLDLGDAHALGLSGPQLARWVARGLGVGLVGIGFGLVACWWGGALVPALRYAPGKTVWKVLLGLAGALGIGVGEELLFRGVLLRRLTLDAGPRVALVATTALYAAVHAIRGGGGDVSQGPMAGWARTAWLVAPLGEPTTWPSLAGLGGLGLLLAWCRLESGTLWLSIGLHAGWVAVFRVGRLFFDLRRTPAWLVGPGWPPLIGGLAGWLALGATAALTFRLLERSAAVIRGPTNQTKGA